MYEEFKAIIDIAFIAVVGITVFLAVRKKSNKKNNNNKEK